MGPTDGRGEGHDVCSEVRLGERGVALVVERDMDAHTLVPRYLGSLAARTMHAELDGGVDGRADDNPLAFMRGIYAPHF